jgi:uncharacterized protein YndB with AHSA1/START domain
VYGTRHARDDGRFELRFQRRLLRPVSKVWRAITERDQLRAWFPASVDIDPTVRARLRFDLVPESRTRHGVSDEDMTLYREVTAVDPPRLLEYTWDAEVLRWEPVSRNRGPARLPATPANQHATPVRRHWSRSTAAACCDSPTSSTTAP